MGTLRQKIKSYWPLIKIWQTLLLLVTGVAGYLSARCPVTSFPLILGLIAALFLSISGCTILNMWYDRDIDAKMERTRKRPLATGEIPAREGLLVGLGMSALGVLLAVLIDPLFGLIIFAGLFFDVVVYTIWLKRRSSWSIIWGGISGAMPILAGRALGLGAIDWIGILLGLGILLWIPTHILTFTIKYFDDYQAAGIPTIASTYGINVNRRVIAFSSILASLAMAVGGWGLGMAWGYLRLLAVLSLGLVGLAVVVMTKPDEKVNFGLFKYASVYMLASMTMIAI